MSEETPFRVLALDGGGIRGVLPALLLQELERRTGRTVPELFDLVVGTSTGGILALALTAPRTGDRFTPADLVKLYETQGGRIFAPWPQRDEADEARGGRDRPRAAHPARPIRTRPGCRCPGRARSCTPSSAATASRRRCARCSAPRALADIKKPVRRGDLVRAGDARRSASCAAGRRPRRRRPTSRSGRPRAPRAPRPSSSRPRPSRPSTDRRRSTAWTAASA